jgi:pyruvate formate lyase activating enzyme
MPTGRVFDIQRFSIHDGPGIRTTVFLKGCPLRCLWCGNPESISPKPQLSYVAEKCIACGECVKACPRGALSLDAAQNAALDRKRCDNCGRCAAVCDAKALEMVGRDATVDEVLAVVLRDRDYYAATGGGMTLSGGEPLQQPDFAEALLHAAKGEGLHSCIETSGMAEWAVFERLLPLVDLWLYDFKETDPQWHAKFTGFGNSPILANLRSLHRAGAKILLRCPMIPQHNARQAHLDGIAALAQELPKLAGVELLPYYDLWRAKLKRFGLPSTLPESVKPPDRATINSWIDYLRQRGVRVVS